MTTLDHEVVVAVRVVVVVVGNAVLYRFITSDHIQELFYLRIYTFEICLHVFIP